MVPVRFFLSGFGSLALVIGCSVADPQYPAAGPVGVPGARPGENFKPFVAADYDRALLAGQKIDVDRSTGMLKNLQLQISQNTSSLSLDKGPASTGVRKGLLNGDFDPIPQGLLPTSSAQDFLIERGKVNAVWLAAGKIEKSRPRSILSQQDIQVVLTKAPEPSDFVSGYLTASGLEAILPKKNGEAKRLVPLLQSENKLYRLAEVAFASADGKPLQVLTSAVEAPFPAEGQRFPLFTNLRLTQAEVDRIRNESLYLRLVFRPLGSGAARKALKKILPGTRGTILSDGNAALERTATEMLQVFASRRAADSMQQYFDQALVGDQAMHALASVQAQGEPEWVNFGVASGNVNDGTFLDWRTESNFWVYSNPKERAAKEVQILFEEAPQSDPTWQYLFTARQEAAIRARLEEPTRTDFRLAELFEKPLKEKLPLAFDAAEIEKLPRKMLDTLTVFLGNSDLSGKPGKGRRYYSFDETTKNRRAYYYVEIRKFMGWGAIGETFIVDAEMHPLSNGTEASTPFARPITGLDAKAVVRALGWDLKERTERKDQSIVALGIRELPDPANRGYVWPEVPADKKAQLAKEFYKEFVGGDIEVTDPVEGPNQDDDVFAGVIRTSAAIPREKAAEFSTHRLVRFWRDRKFEVLPVQRLQIDAVIHARYEEPKKK